MKIPVNNRDYLRWHDSRRHGRYPLTENEIYTIYQLVGCISRVPNTVFEPHRESERYFRK